MKNKPITDAEAEAFWGFREKDVSDYIDFVARLLADRKVAMEIIEAIENLNPAHCFKIAGSGHDNPLIPCCTLCKARALIAAVKGGE